jgi:proteasome lid subunit RPN8/RPN11
MNRKNISTDLFELREIRNEIAHDYDDNEEKGREIINSIYKHKRDIASVLTALQTSR